MTKSKRLAFGELEGLKAIKFQNPDRPGEWYVIEAEESHWADFSKKYPDGRRATGVNLDGSEQGLFVVLVQDCMDPPIAIVRADNVQDAEEHFVDELDWAHISEPDLKDYDAETLGYGPHGQPYDSDGVCVRELLTGEIRLIR